MILTENEFKAVKYEKPLYDFHVYGTSVTSYRFVKYFGITELNCNGEEIEAVYRFKNGMILLSDYNTVRELVELKVKRNDLQFSNELNSWKLSPFELKTNIAGFKRWNVVFTKITSKNVKKIKLVNHTGGELVMSWKMFIKRDPVTKIKKFKRI